MHKQQDNQTKIRVETWHIWGFTATHSGNVNKNNIATKTWHRKCKHKIQINRIPKCGLNNNSSAFAQYVQ